ncbi:MAG TPA: hypothetical protein VG755_28695 [Nannocystaceae bacterium]|nr:hypothetical protein [Nannocystaceae bacterium]
MVDGVTLVLVVAAGASVLAGLRSRRRVRALIEQPPDDAPQCTSARPGVQRFFDETRIVHALAVDASTAAPVWFDLHHSRHDANAPVSELLRAADRWALAYVFDLDEEDRAELHDRGITAARVRSLRDATTVARDLDRITRELQNLVDAMALPPSQRAYR